MIRLLIKQKLTLQTEGLQQISIINSQRSTDTKDTVSHDIYFGQFNNYINVLLTVTDHCILIQLIFMYQWTELFYIV